MCLESHSVCVWICGPASEHLPLRICVTSLVLEIEGLPLRLIQGWGAHPQWARWAPWMVPFLVEPPMVHHLLISILPGDPGALP